MAESVGAAVERGVGPALDSCLGLMRAARRAGIDDERSDTRDGGRPEHFHPFTPRGWDWGWGGGVPRLRRGRAAGAGRQHAAARRLPQRPPRGGAGPRRPRRRRQGPQQCAPPSVPRADPQAKRPHADGARGAVLVVRRRFCSRRTCLASTSTPAGQATRCWARFGTRAGNPARVVKRQTKQHRPQSPSQ